MVFTFHIFFHLNSMLLFSPEIIKITGRDSLFINVSQENTIPPALCLLEFDYNEMSLSKYKYL